VLGIGLRGTRRGVGFYSFRPNLIDDAFRNTAGKRQVCGSRLSTELHGLVVPTAGERNAIMKGTLLAKIR
jgi:hypothetical protein